MRFDPKQKIYVICETGALGDTIATFPILLKLQAKGHIEKLFVDDRFLDLYKLLFKPELIVRLKDAMTIIPKEKVTPDIPSHVINPRTGEASFLSYPLNPYIPVVHSMNPNTLLPIHASLVDAFSAAIGQCLLKDDEKDYPFVSKDLLPANPMSGKKYAVISYGSTTEHRKMTEESFEAIKGHLKNIGLEVVLLGKKDHQLAISSTGELTTPKFDGLNTEGCVDLIDKTTLLESLSIISDAKMLIGVDGGLVHLAGMTDVPIVGGFTTVDPYYRTIYRHKTRGWKFYEVVPDSECRFCQTDTFCTYGINFHICHTRTKECMFSLTPDKWIRMIDKALEDSNV